METTFEKQIKERFVPKFCWVCGNPLEEIGLGYYLCLNDDCKSIFLPSIDLHNEQNLILIHINNGTKK